MSTCLSPYCLGLFIPLSVFLLFFISFFFCVLVCLCWLCYILSCFFFFNFFIFIMFSCHWEVVTAVVHAFVIALTSTCVLTRLKNAIRHHYPVKLFVCMSVRCLLVNERVYMLYINFYYCIFNPLPTKEKNPGSNIPVENYCIYSLCLIAWLYVYYKAENMKEY